MKVKSFVFCAAMALVLVGCNQAKEEGMENVTAVTAEQQQQALPVVSGNNVVAEAKVPAAVPVVSTMPEQGNINVIGQQAAVPQVAPEQVAPPADLQNQAQPIQPSQLVQAVPATQVAPEVVAPASNVVPVAAPTAAQTGVPQGGMVMADKVVPANNAPAVQYNVVGNAQSAVPAQGVAPTAGQTTEVVGTRVL